MREDWKFSNERFEARVVQIKEDPPAWVLVIRENDKPQGDYIRNGFETLADEGLIPDGGYSTPAEGMREAERVLRQLGVVVPDSAWGRSTRD